MDLTDHDVRAILQLLDASAFDELDLETDAFKLTLRRADGGGWSREDSVRRSAPLLEAAAAPTAAGLGPGAAAGAAIPVGAAVQPGAAPVHSPLPGTFYRSPKPGAPPFVELDMQVEPETVIAIVETMKLMTSIRAGAAGRIVEICAADGELIAQNQVLARIRPEPA
jgi:acetyl-CoA carboxylase biotin carboxyl carrier protein